MGSLDNHRKYTFNMPFFPAILLELLLLGDAELASIADRLAVLKSEGAPSVPDSAISIGRSSDTTATTAEVTQFSEVINHELEHIFYPCLKIHLIAMCSLSRIYVTEIWKIFPWE